MLPAVLSTMGDRHRLYAWDMQQPLHRYKLLYKMFYIYFQLQLYLVRKAMSDVVQ